MCCVRPEGDRRERREYRPINHPEAPERGRCRCRESPALFTPAPLPFGGLRPLVRSLPSGFVHPALRLHRHLSGALSGQTRPCGGFPRRRAARAFRARSMAPLNCKAAAWLPQSRPGVRTFEIFPANCNGDAAWRGCSFSECASHACAFSRQAMRAGLQRGPLRTSRDRDWTGMTRCVDRAKTGAAAIAQGNRNAFSGRIRVVIPRPG